MQANIRLRCRSLIVASLLTAASFAAQANTATITLVDDADGGPPQLEVLGEWTSGCLPQLRDVRVDGSELTLTAQPDSTNCAAEPGPYSLRAALPAELKSGASGGVWRLRYELRDDPLSAPRLMAFELVELRSADAAIAMKPTAIDPEKGFWWGEAGGEFDHAGPGMGAQLERQSGTLALTFSGYGDAGHPEWLFGATSMQGAVSDIALSRLDGGRGPFGGYRGPKQASDAGRLQIEWLTSARAVFWFSRPVVDGDGIELQPISMVRFDFGQDPGSGWLGRWALNTDDGKSPIVLELSEYVAREDGFTLLGKRGEALQCDTAPSRPQSPPALCELQLADGGILRFEDVGLSRLRGIDENGKLVTASLADR